MSSRRRRNIDIFNLSFLDVVSCGFGAIILLLVIVKVSEPHVIEQLAVDLTGLVARLEAELHEMRGDTTVLNRELTDRQEQLSESREKLARLRGDISSVRGRYATTRNEHEAQTIIARQLASARQELTEEMRRVLGAGYERQHAKSTIGGVPVDSEYIIFVIDTSGSMQMAAWPRVRAEMMNILNIYPDVIGIQVLNDQGQYMFPDTRRAWMKDSPSTRRRIIDALDSWAPFSNSSPVEGINAAIQTFYKPDRKISIYTLGDDFSGRSIHAVVKAVNNLNQAQQGTDRLVRIHAIGFPVHFRPGRTPSEAAMKFAALMRELSYNNGGTFIGLPGL